VIDAAEQLELQATLAVDASVAGFDSSEGEAPEEDRLAASVSSFSIGFALVAAEASSSDGNADHLARAVELLERNTDELEAAGAPTPAADHFDTEPGGVALSPHAAALAALDEMASSAADVATSILDQALKPLVDKLPDPVPDVVEQLQLNIGGRLASLGLRAVRSGLSLLLTLIDLHAVSQARDRINDLLSRLGQGNDPAVLTGWAMAPTRSGRPLPVQLSRRTGPASGTRCRSLPDWPSATRRSAPPSAASPWSWSGSAVCWHCCT